MDLPATGYWFFQTLSAADMDLVLSVRQLPIRVPDTKAGDIILSVNGTPTHPFRKIARHFGSESIGRKADLRVIRGGAVITVQTSIVERPAA